LVTDRNIRSATFVDKRRPSYSENWFRVVGLGLEDVIRLGRKYGQESVHIDGVGSLDVDSLIVTPEIARHHGKDATEKQVFAMIEGMGPIAWALDPKKKYKLP